MNVPALVKPCCAAIALAAATLAQAATPAELLAGYSAKAAATASPEKGQKFFVTNFGRDLGFSCSSCHTANPTKEGKDQVTEKRIKPLAPAANPDRFTDAHKVEFHFDLNCKDVVGRICTPAEKADLLAWLMSLKP
jgi:mono/diheme cytochrome c family protein